jgi:hypothetical protein
MQLLLDLLFALLTYKCSRRRRRTGRRNKWLKN